MKKNLRDDVLNFVKRKYRVSGDCPWAKYPNYVVLRHGDNNKWFGLIADVGYDKLGLQKNGKTDILNVKTDPIVIGGFVKNPGILPAYHMNKSSWATILLDGSIPMSDIEFLLNVSFELTKTQKKNTIKKKD